MTTMTCERGNIALKQKELSNLLIFIGILVTLAVAACCALIAPGIGHAIADDYPEYAYMYLPCLIYVWMAAVPVLISCFISIKIFLEIGRDNSFCEENSIRLRHIGRLFLFETIYLFLGIAIMGILRMLFLMVFVCLSLACAVSLCATVVCSSLSHLTYKAYLLKKDNDLTI